MSVTVHKAETHEMTWVNEQYDEVGFVQSDFTKEIIAVAEIDGQKVGVGRLVHVNGNDWELGGMYVLTEYRGKGVAAQLVMFLLTQVHAQWRVFCLPFDHLAAFYAKFGFRECPGDMIVPVGVQKKHRWCNQAYKHKTLLCVLY